jgi:hypothetical protein
MSTLDFNVRYEYAQSRSGIEVPIRLSVGADHSVEFLAKVDSGADFCIFQREYAELLELRMHEGVHRRFSTATGAFDTRGHVVKISCLGYDVESEVFFSVEEGFPRNVLGLHGWLEKFRFAVVHYDRSIYLATTMSKATTKSSENLNLTYRMFHVSGKR